MLTYFVVFLHYIFILKNIKNVLRNTIFLNGLHKGFKIACQNINCVFKYNLNIIIRKYLWDLFCKKDTYVHHIRNRYLLILFEIS